MPSRTRISATATGLSTSTTRTATSSSSPNALDSGTADPQQNDPSRRGFSLEFCHKSLRTHHPVAVGDIIADLNPVDRTEIEPDPNPAARAKIGRKEEALVAAFEQRFVLSRLDPTG